MKILFKILIIIGVAIFAPTIESVSQVLVEKSRNVVKRSGDYFYVHTVLKGQTIYSISRAYGVKQEDILKANLLREGEKIKVRSALYIPANEFFNKTKDTLKRAETTYNQNTIPQNTIAPFLTQAPEPKALKVDTLEEGMEVETIPNGAIFANPTVGTTMGNANLGINIRGGKIKAVFMLDRGAGAKNGQDLLRGAMIAVEELRREGIDATVESDAINGVGGDASFIVAMNSRYNEAAQITKSLQVPLVSPLVSPTFSNGYTIDFVPNNFGKYEKFRETFSNPQNNIILVKHDVYCDTAAYREMKTVLPLGVTELNYSRTNVASDIAVALDKNRENIIVIPLNHQGSVEDILSKITSLNSLKKDYKIQVVGTNRWKNMSNINPELLFKANVFYPTSHHADRADKKMNDFFNNYIKQYGELPNAFSMRGYDIVWVLSNAIKELGSSTLQTIVGREFKPAQTAYKFLNQGDRLSNYEWVIVNMTPDYKIIAQ